MEDDDYIGEDRFSGRGDDFYADLMAAHDGLDAAASAVLNARLVLLLANQVGDPVVLKSALAIARRTTPGSEPAKP